MGSPDLHTRRQAVHVGGVVQVGLAALAAAYALVTWAEPWRGPMLAIGLAVGALGIVILARPPRWLVASGPNRGAMVAWNVSHSALVPLVCALDGGLTSPFVAVFFIGAIFIALDQPADIVTWLSAKDVVAIAVLAAACGQLDGRALFLGGALTTITFISAYVARDREARLAALRASNHELIDRLARVVEHRDTDTARHVERMSAICSIVARRLGWSPAARAELRVASTMHDVGKVAVPDAILLKPGPLDPEERAVMETHARAGHDMLAGSTNPTIQLAARIALTHHERFDGTGYPQGLAGEDIPIEGRIVAVADVFDALTSDRVYRPAMVTDQALAILEDGRGSHFDPQVLDAFRAGLPEILALCDRAGDEEPAALAASPAAA